MSNTPETDAAAFDVFDGQGGDEVVFANLARRFDRERDEARKQLRVAVGLLSTTPRFQDQHPEEVLKFVEEAVK